MSNPFSPEFVLAMEAILKQVDNKPNALLYALEKSEQDKRQMEYLTFDNALAYLSYKGTQNAAKEDSEMLQYLPKFVKRINDNLEEMRNIGTEK